MGKKLAIVVFLAALVIGLYLMGSGITGFVISQSCCLGQSCSQENLCDFARPNLESPREVSGNASKIYFGSALVCICIMAAVVFAHPELIRPRKAAKKR